MPESLGVTTVPHLLGSLSRPLVLHKPLCLDLAHFSFPQKKEHSICFHFLSEMYEGGFLFPYPMSPQPWDYLRIKRGSIPNRTCSSAFEIGNTKRVDCCDSSSGHPISPPPSFTCPLLHLESFSHCFSQLQGNGE